jgi:hypothetical protein
VRIRVFVAGGLGVLIGWYSVATLFPRIHNDLSCEDSVPVNSAQVAALGDARVRKTAVCLASKSRCKFDITAEDDGSIRVRLYFVVTDFFEGCVRKGQDDDEFVYGPEGSFVRIEGAPYA